MVELLKLEDTNQKLNLFTELVHKINSGSILPELSQTTETQHYIDALMKYSSYMPVFVNRDAESIALCMVADDDLNPHILGNGLVLAITISIGDPKYLVELIREMRKLAKGLNKDWMLVHHRVKPYEYRAKYYRFNNG